MTSSKPLIGMFVLLAAACGQSYEGGVKLLCDRPSMEKAMGGATGSDGVAKIVAWAEQNVTNPKAKEVVARLATAAPGDRNLVLLAAKTDAGLEECLAAGLFAGRPLPEDPRDAAARAFALELGKAELAAFLGQPVDPRFLGPDAAADVRKISCDDVSWQCSVPADRWNPSKERLARGATVVGVAIRLGVAKAANALRIGYMAWDDARATAMGNALQWLATAAGTPFEPSVADAAALGSQAPAIAGFAGRAVDCLRPPACSMPFLSPAAANMAGEKADALLRGNDIAAGEKAIGEAPGGASDWKITDVVVQVLVAGDASSEKTVRDTGSWLQSQLFASEGKIHLGPIGSVSRADDI